MMISASLEDRLPCPVNRLLPFGSMRLPATAVKGGSSRAGTHAVTHGTVPPPCSGPARAARFHPPQDHLMAGFALTLAEPLEVLDRPEVVLAGCRTGHARAGAQPVE